MKKAPLFAIATAALLFASAAPAFAHDRDNVGFSFGIVVNDRGYDRGYDRAPPRYYRDSDDCDRDGRSYYRRGYYERPYYYSPRERVVVIDRDRRGWERRHWHKRWHDRDWDD